ncbi:LOW QUALITY PROTEIN: hypothetical protein PHMEG_0007110 [Phytophthora megakarya]|uniref:Uncharacterized protein n=1 Tax=Phytophthora megakarya TaxID=4795 RepID=A0A225WMM0_9STRA|nr:LOW QUALITY PROTEIN: hypothetical protein PHMEG_0007110 [Phytophthora megakarya]
MLHGLSAKFGKDYAIGITQKTIRMLCKRLKWRDGSITPETHTTLFYLNHDGLIKPTRIYGGCFPH